MSLPTTLVKADAEELVRDLAGQSWPVQFSGHAIWRTETRSVDSRDVLRALCRGKVVEDPEWDATYRDWKVRVEAEIDGVFIRVHAAIDEERPGKMILVVVTVVAADA
jgi:hypothetical protein